MHGWKTHHLRTSIALDSVFDWVLLHSKDSSPIIDDGVVCTPMMHWI